MLACKPYHQQYPEFRKTQLLVVLGSHRHQGADKRGLTLCLLAKQSASLPLLPSQLHLQAS